MNRHARRAQAVRARVPAPQAKPPAPSLEPELAAGQLFPLTAAQTHITMVQGDGHVNLYRALVDDLVLSKQSELAKSLIDDVEVPPALFTLAKTPNGPCWAHGTDKNIYNVIRAAKRAWEKGPYVLFMRRTAPHRDVDPRLPGDASPTPLSYGFLLCHPALGASVLAHFVLSTGSDGWWVGTSAKFGGGLVFEREQTP